MGGFKTLDQVIKEAALLERRISVTVEALDSLSSELNELSKFAKKQGVPNRVSADHIVELIEAIKMVLAE